MPLSTHPRSLPSTHSNRVSQSRASSSTLTARSTVTLMRNQGVPDHIVAKFHGHDETVMRWTYSHAHIEELKIAAAALSFGP